MKLQLAKVGSFVETQCSNKNMLAAAHCWVDSAVQEKKKTTVFEMTDPYVKLLLSFAEWLYNIIHTVIAL